MGVTISYQNETIASMDRSGTTVLETDGKYCEGDIEVEYEPILQARTVEPTMETQVITADTLLASVKDIIDVGEYTGTMTRSKSVRVDSILTLGNQYRCTGTISFIDSEENILQTINFNTLFTYTSNVTSNSYIYRNGDSNSYLTYATIDQGANTDFLLLQYTLNQNGTYGIIINLEIHENIVYNGLSSVTVGKGYDETLIKNYISRSNSFTDIVWPEGITQIGNYAFASCNYFNPVSLPSSVIVINPYAFYSCTKLALTSLPNSITNIGSYAFYQCSNLALTSLPSGITSISSYTFYNCTKLALTSLSNNITVIAEYAFCQCSNLALTSLPNNIKVINNSSFRGCTQLALTSLPSGLEQIGNYGLSRCTNITISTLPNTLTYIDSNAFRSCTKITSISSNAIITTLGSGAFWGDSDYFMTITSVNFPNMELSSLTTVFGSTTVNSACRLLEFCDIGLTRAIAGNAFANCYALETLILRRTSGVCTLNATSAFTNTPMSGYNNKTGTVYVPSALISSYQTASNWSTLYNNGTVSFQAIEGSDYELDD